MVNGQTEKQLELIKKIEAEKQKAAVKHCVDTHIAAIKQIRGK